MKINCLNLKILPKLLFAVICFLLLACNAEKEPVEKSKPKHNTELQDKINTQEERVHTANKEIEIVNKNIHSSDGFISVKPHAPIELQFSLPEKINLDIESLLELNIISSQKADKLIISVWADEGVVILNDQKQFVFGPQIKNQTNNIRVLLLPDQPGLFYFHISATLIMGEQKQSRSFVIPLKIGDLGVLESLKGGSNTLQDKSGKSVISMPAVETSN